MIVHRHQMETLSPTDERCKKCPQRRHTHHWDDLDDARYQGPRQFRFSGGYIDDAVHEHMERASRGFTQWHQRCTGCGTVRTQITYGRYQPEAKSSDPHLQIVASS